MTATIYVTKEAMTTIIAIKDLDYYDRCVLSDEITTDPTRQEGYYLKNANKLTVATLPADAHIAVRLRPKDAAYAAHVSFPVQLRGVIFQGAKHLPKYYKEIIHYWSGETLNSNAGGAAYYQNKTGAYWIDLSALHTNPQLASQRQSTPAIDALVSEGVVICISGLGLLVTNAPVDAFIEIEIPIDEKMLGIDNGEFMTEKSYDLRPGQRMERIFLRVSDVRNSPDPDCIYGDFLRSEELDYGFYY